MLLKVYNSINVCLIVLSLIVLTTLFRAPTLQIAAIPILSVNVVRHLITVLLRLETRTMSRPRTMRGLYLALAFTGILALYWMAGLENKNILNSLKQPQIQPFYGRGKFCFCILSITMFALN